MADEKEQVEFLTLKQEEVKFGTNNFVEVASKKAVSATEERPFISITRGYYRDGADKRFVKAISIPNEKDVVGAFQKALKAVAA